MIVKAKFKDETKRVLKAADKGAYKSLGHAAASFRRLAISLIKRGKKASAPGQPPRTRKGLLRKAIFFDVDKRTESAVIGPRSSVVGAAGQAHEFGGVYKGARYPARPFMGPALEKARPRLPKSFQGSIG